MHVEEGQGSLSVGDPTPNYINLNSESTLRQDSGLIGRSSTTVRKTDPRYDTLFNEYLAEQENDVLLSRIPGATNRLVLIGPTLVGQPSAVASWNSAYKRYIASMDTLYTIRMGIAEESRTNEPELLATSYMQELFKLSACLLVHDSIDRMREVSQTHGFHNTIGSGLDLLDFALAGVTIVPMPDISITDMMRDQGHRYTPAEYLGFFIGVAQARHRADLRPILPRQRTNLVEEFPQLASSYVHDASFMVNAGFAVNYEMIKSKERVEGFAGLQNMLSRYSGRIEQITQHIFSSILDPDSKDFKSLAETVSIYLSGGLADKVFALMRMGIDTRSEHIVKAYRRSREYSLQDREVDFYELLAESSVRDLVEEGYLSGTFFIPTYDNIAEILDESVEDSEHTEPNLNRLGQIVSTIFQNARLGDTEISPEDIEWGNLIPPESVRVEFDKQRPQKFKIPLTWENQIGEQLEVNLDIDTKKNVFDWNFLESPDDPQMKPLRGALLQAIEDILLQFEERAKQIRLNRIMEKHPGITTPSTNIKREHQEDEIYRLRKQVRQEAKAAQQSEAFSLPPAEAEKTVIKQIILPSETVLYKLLQSLSTVDQQIIIGGIQDFNDRGVGKFTRKKLRGRNSEILYTLAVGCSVPKGARVLLTETADGNGDRRFEILDIKYRKDIYRKAGI